jgi:hypothetical protein
MTILLTLIWFTIVVFGFIAYVGMCFASIQIVGCKKTWKRIATGFASLVFTPILFLLVWLLFQNFYSIKNNF